MLHVIFPAESNFPIRLSYIFYFTFSLTFKAFVMFVTFLLFQSNFYIVLVHGKVLKIAFIEILVRQKTLNKEPLEPNLFYLPYGAWIGLDSNSFSQLPQKFHISKIFS